MTRQLRRECRPKSASVTKRAKQYLCQEAKCHCGVRQLICKTSRTRNSLACNVHKKAAGKSVRATAEIVSKVLKQMNVEFLHFQEWPLGLRALTGLFRKGFVSKMDLVYQAQGCLFAVEVHGSKEHLDDPGAVSRDSQKARHGALR